MTTDESYLARLTKLEREVRLYRLGVIVAFMVVVAAAPSQRAKRSVSLEAQSLTLIDSSGAIRATFEANSRGAMLKLLGSNGSEGLIVGHDKGASIVVRGRMGGIYHGVEDGGPKVWMHDANFTTRMSVRSDPQMTVLSLFDANGIDKINLRQYRDDSEMELRGGGQSGWMRARVGGQETRLELCDPSGMQAYGAVGGGSSTWGAAGTNGKFRANLYCDDGRAGIAAYDRSGKLKYVKP